MTCHLFGAKPLSETNAGLTLIAIKGAYFSGIRKKYNIQSQKAFETVVCNWWALRFGLNVLGGHVTSMANLMVFFMIPYCVIFYCCKFAILY